MAVCRSAWVWVCLAETPCVSRDRLVFIRGLHKTQSASKNDIWGKMKKGHVIVLAQNSKYVWASSGQQAASVFQWATASHKTVLMPAIPVCSRPRGRRKQKSYKTQDKNLVFHY